MLTRRIAVSACALCLVVAGVAGAQPAWPHPSANAAQPDLEAGQSPHDPRVAAAGVGCAPRDSLAVIQVCARP
jgi:hypothetical protein